MINILERITELRVRQGWSEYQLAEKSDVPQSTISSWYRKQMMPSFFTLEKICHAFGITLSQFFAAETESFPLNTKQLELINEYSKLSQDQQERLLDFLKSL